MNHGGWLVKLAKVALVGLVGTACSPKSTIMIPTNSNETMTTEQSQPHVASKLFPKTRRDEVVETMFGHEVQDPYRWLEQGNSEEVKAWVAQQNKFTSNYLRNFPTRESLQTRLEHLLHTGMVSAPEIRKIDRKQFRYFYIKRSQGQNQAVLMMKDGINGKERVLIDPNLLSTDGTMALDWWYPSSNGNLIAFGLSTSGSERSTLYILEVARGQRLTDVIPYTRFSSVAWLPDHKGFYYTRYPEPGKVAKGEENYWKKVYLHQLGQDFHQDKLIFEEKSDKTASPSVELSPNGKVLAISVHRSWSHSELWLMDVSKNQPGDLIEIAKGREFLYEPHLFDNELWLLTNDDAPHYRLVSLKLNDALKPGWGKERSNWKTILPENPKAVLKEVLKTDQEIVASYLENVHAQVRVFDQKGVWKRDVTLPGLGTVSALRGREQSAEFFLEYSSFATPPKVIVQETGSSKVTTWAEASAPFDPAGFEIKQGFATSKDGTKVPYFLIRKHHSLPSSPTVIYAYGGFNVSLTPEFRRPFLLWPELGGTLVVANLRGGGEFGESWHKAGMLDKKQNVFDDLYAVAEHVGNEEGIDKTKMAIWGGSNGGLLSAVAVTQRPRLFRAAVSAVPLTDMIRFPKFLIAELWTSEYGNPSQKKDFEWLYAYSPYHQVKSATEYPAVLFTTAESDSRVDPCHARKMAAQLQQLTISQEPILLRVESDAGHGAGKPVSKQVDEFTDIYSFLCLSLHWPCSLPPSPPASK
jgi:prolyl oligopeptidase